MEISSEEMYFPADSIEEALEMIKEIEDLMKFEKLDKERREWCLMRIAELQDEIIVMM